MRPIIFFFLVLLSFSSCTIDKKETVPENQITSTTNSSPSLSNYTKKEVYIEMRDGVKLFTAIYTPKDTSKTYPVLLKRTPYGTRPYGSDTMPYRLTHNEQLAESGYIFIIQDVRGRWMSEGVFENTKPPYSFSDSAATDEITDSWDTFEWLKDSLPHYNGKVGMYGNSYLGWTTLVGACTNHPSLKAAMPMAPVTNFYFEDFNRYGLFSLSYLPIINVFGTAKEGPTDTAWWPKNEAAYLANDSLELSTDYYDFFLERFTLDNYNDVLDSTDFFWKNIKAHPTYDEYRKKRDWISYLDTITCPVMVVGGWNDEQNLYGILNAYKKLEATNPNAQFVMGPWSHGHPVRNDSAYYLGDVFYGYELSKNFMADIEFNYFEYHLKDKGKPLDFKVKLFDTGKNEWAVFKKYPSKSIQPLRLNLVKNELTKNKKNVTSKGNRTFYADPFNPVPYVEDENFHKMPPKSYFTADQRFVSKRPDVLSFETPPLQTDLTVVGTVKALIDFATDHQDADIYVKLIDVYPQNRIPLPTDPEGVKMNGYQQLVRVGYIRGRYRDGFEQGKPFVPNEKTTVNVPLLDIFHTFKKGHKIKVQIQSSMFPLFDLNPQNYIEDIYTAKKSDFEPAIHKVYETSTLLLPVLK